MNITEALYNEEQVITSEKSIETARKNLYSVGVKIDETVSNDKLLLIFMEGNRWKTAKITKEGIVLSRKRYA